MDTNTLLDSVKERYSIASDNALARSLLKVDPMSLRDMRRRGLSDERALQVATLLDLNPGEVLAAIHAERAKSPEVRAVWQRVAESMRSALGVVAAAAVALLVAMPTEVCVLC